MIRVLRVVPVLFLAVALGGQPARAQWGYGGWGWGGGWGQTPAGAYMAGAGRYAMGAGIYNYDTALATQINAQTYTALNEYWANVAAHAARVHHARVHQEFLKDKTLYDQHIQALRDAPTPQQIENGDALNQAVRDLSDPRLGSSSALRAAKAPVEARTIAEVPFENATERVTIMLDQLRAAFDWPAVFEDPRYADNKKMFDEVLARMRREDEDGEISPKTLQEAKDMLRGLQAEFAQFPPKDENDRRDATRFINAFGTLLGLLNKPDTRAALEELRKVQNTTIGNLLGFMHAYNLRFAPAKTLKERRAYQQLWETLDQTRDQILAEAKLDLSKPISNNPQVITDFYGRIRPKSDDSLDNNSQ